jgi:TPR repeat protein
MKYQTPFLLIVIFFSQQTIADFKAGGDAYKRGDYETAAKEFLPVAEKGDHRAMYALGSMYAAGEGVPQDYQAALKWFRSAAKYGRPDAQYKIGLMYDNGLGVSQDYKKAINWYGKAAKKGYGQAQYKIGLMYFKGNAVTQSNIKSFAWLNTALSNGVSEAKTNLDAMTELLSPEQLKEAQALSQEYQQKYRRRY